MGRKKRVAALNQSSPPVVEEPKIEQLLLKKWLKTYKKFTVLMPLKK